jgi:prepilin-type N-terminal cleavage/methylation domain-containing protein
MNKNNKNRKGFTLLELLIVIGIIAILSVILILVLNPAETLKKSRDVQRMSDLATMKTALGLILTSSTTPLLSGTVGNTLCEGGTGADSIWYSIGSDTTSITDADLDGGTLVDVQVTAVNLTLTDGTGWIPVRFSWLSGGSPISNLPIDPTNTISSGAAVTTSDLVYRYGCDASDLTFEFDARLESTAYTSDDNRMTKDGGNNSNLFESGTKLTILGTGVDF